MAARSVSNCRGYGVQLVFSDGHDCGIYPWDYLRELGSTPDESAQARVGG
ncbi:gamma-butyrobetaine hydroxylase-like domain-containing protein [Pseudomonas phoenicis]